MESLSVVLPADSVTATRHVPVLLHEVLAILAPLAGKTVVDGTLGGGGHARALLEGGVERLFGLDWDTAALARCQALIDDFGGRVCLFHAGYDALGSILDQAGVPLVDGILLDLGFSSDQLDDPLRGLSYHHDGPLDMRIDSRSTLTAAGLLAEAHEEELMRIFRDYGEEPKARVLARAIVTLRKNKPLTTTFDLVRVVEEIYPPRRGLARAHPAARIFQALRVAVNDELAVLQRALQTAANRLAPGGILAVITFQPLEERMVKQVFRALCVDELDEVGRVAREAPYQMTKKFMAGEAELVRNPRARSAILRGLQRVGERP